MFVCHLVLQLTREKEQSDLRKEAIETLKVTRTQPGQHAARAAGAARAARAARALLVHLERTSAVLSASKAGQRTNPAAGTLAMG